MDVSCWTFIRMAHLAEPLMRKGGTLFTMSYYGSQMVVKNYNIMGVAKAALECAVRYIAAAEDAARELPTLPLEAPCNPCISTSSEDRRRPSRAAWRWLVRYLSEGTPSLRDVAKVTASLASAKSRRGERN